jgi:hypothetical protein
MTPEIRHRPANPPLAVAQRDPGAGWTGGTEVLSRADSSSRSVFRRPASPRSDLFLRNQRESAVRVLALAPSRFFKFRVPNYNNRRTGGASPRRKGPRLLDGAWRQALHGQGRVSSESTDTRNRGGAREWLPLQKLSRACKLPAPWEQRITRGWRVEASGWSGLAGPLRPSNPGGAASPTRRTASC